MTVYVDELRDYRQTARDKGLRWTQWAHLTADTPQELHAFAAQLGLRRAWFQAHPWRWHYDVTAGKRAQALSLGAKAITVRELGVIVHVRRLARHGMKALTVWQPHATAIAVGAKRFETRSRPTSYRGPLAIQAGTHFDLEQQDLCFAEPFTSMLLAAGIQTPDDLPRGAVLAVTELTDVLPTDCPQITGQLTERELAFGDFSPGRWAWVLRSTRLLPAPIPARGAQGLWQWRLPSSDETADEVRQ